MRYEGDCEYQDAPEGTKMSYDDSGLGPRHGPQNQGDNRDVAMTGAVLGIVLGLLLALLIVACSGGKFPPGFVESIQRMGP